MHFRHECNIMKLSFLMVAKLWFNGCCYSSRKYSAINRILKLKSNLFAQPSNSAKFKILNDFIPPTEQKLSSLNTNKLNINLILRFPRVLSTRIYHN